MRKSELENLYPQNVRNFSEKARTIVGNYQGEWFDVCVFRECVQGSLGGKPSPIEQLFYIASKTILNLHDADGFIKIYPQYQIGNYRADFALERQSNKKIIIVELDGHNFHDKDESQRRYEKKRDRYFQKQGYQIFHFTGKEVTDNPFIPASEVLSELLCEDQNYIIAHLENYGVKI